MHGKASIASRSSLVNTTMYRYVSNLSSSSFMCSSPGFALFFGEFSFTPSVYYSFWRAAFCKSDRPSDYDPLLNNALISGLLTTSGIPRARIGHSQLLLGSRACFSAATRARRRLKRAASLALPSMVPSAHFGLHFLLFDHCSKNV